MPKIEPEMKPVPLGQAAHFFNWCMDKGLFMAVYGDQGDELDAYTNDPVEAQDAAQACGSALVAIYSGAKMSDAVKVGVALIIYGNDPDEEMADYSDNKLMEEWNVLYEKSAGYGTWN